MSKRLTTHHECRMEHALLWRDLEVVIPHGPDLLQYPNLSDAPFDPDRHDLGYGDAIVSRNEKRLPHRCSEGQR